jgi:HAD superfamily hydrolase (TIGR01509 family)
MAKFKGVILDIDGTLIDSNDAHAQAWVDALAEEGIRVPFEKIRPLIGMGSDKLLPEVSGIEKASAQGNRLSERRSQIFKEKYLPQVKPFPGVRDLITALQQKGLKLQIATSAQENEVKGLLKVADLLEIAGQKTTSDDADNSKPDPDIVIAALHKMGLPTDQVVMLGDTPYDVEAARKAGIPTYVFRCGGWWQDADFKDAAAIFDGPASLLAKIEDYF